MLCNGVRQQLRYAELRATSYPSPLAMDPVAKLINPPVAQQCAARENQSIRLFLSNQ
jgi:hypothetical protein